MCPSCPSDFVRRIIKINFCWNLSKKICLKRVQNNFQLEIRIFFCPLAIWFQIVYKCMKIKLYISNFSCFVFFLTNWSQSIQFKFPASKKWIYIVPHFFIKSLPLEFLWRIRLIEKISKCPSEMLHHGICVAIRLNTPENLLTLLIMAQVHSKFWDVSNDIGSCQIFLSRNSQTSDIQSYLWMCSMWRVQLMRCDERRLL